MAEYVKNYVFFGKNNGFTGEELYFIINYDIKYHMGKALFGEEVNADEEEED